ncbi:MAG: hypothetical protein JNM63_19635, partial [Spirochaetia bacterium]|nr:hypothetical protein [Spirochaetia bacterium]
MIAFLSAPHFLCECELRRSPELRGSPLLIVSGRKKRSVVLDALPEELARKFPRGTELRQVLRAPPSEPALKFRFLDEAGAKKNQRTNQGIQKQLEAWSPVVRPQPGGSWFIDFTGTQKLFGRTIEAAGRMAAEIGKTWGLSLQVGIGSDPWNARLAGRWAPADTVLEVDADHFSE